MPWLAATAFLHSVMVQEKKGMLKVWNMLLVILAFSLSLFGTFLTRSRRAELDPLVHRGLDRAVVPRLHLLRRRRLARCSLFWRLPLLRSKTKLESLVSREATFLYNNLLLVALCLTILWGVHVPDPVRGGARRVGHGRAAVLRLLPARLRPAAAPADGDRAADRLAAGVARARSERTFLWPSAFALAVGGAG